MEESRIFLRLHYLLALGRENAHYRRIMIPDMLPGQMECIQMIAKQMMDGDIPMLQRDSNYFNRNRRVLRTLASRWVSLARKKRLLLRYHALLPRLLRRHYLGFAMRNEITAAEA